MVSKSLSELKNIGKTVASKLHELGITNEAELRELGSAKAYKWLSEQNPEKRLPVCYYLVPVRKPKLLAGRLKINQLFVKILEV